MVTKRQPYSNIWWSIIKKYTCCIYSNTLIIIIHLLHQLSSLSSFQTQAQPTSVHITSSLHIIILPIKNDKNRLARLKHMSYVKKGVNAWTETLTLLIKVFCFHKWILCAVLGVTEFSMKQIPEVYKWNTTLLILLFCISTISCNANYISYTFFHFWLTHKSQSIAVTM